MAIADAVARVSGRCADADLEGNPRRRYVRNAGESPRAVQRDVSPVGRKSPTSIRRRENSGWDIRFTIMYPAAPTNRVGFFGEDGQPMPCLTDEGMLRWRPVVARHSGKVEAPLLIEAPLSIFCIFFR